MSKDVSNLIKRSGINLERGAFDRFGASTPDTNLGAAFGSRSTGQFIDPNASTRLSPDAAPGNREWNSTRYAATMASGRGGFDPKIKFLFRVSFVFNPSVRETAKRLSSNIYEIVDRNLPFTIKTIDMPKYKFLYDEYNYYNFRTKMLKKIEHEPLSFSMYNDIANNSLDFINAYLQLLSPIHRHQWSANSDLENSGIQPDFEDFQTPTSAQRSVLGSDGNAKNILDEIRIDQYYLDRSDPNQKDPRKAIKMNTFIFKNPRLESFDVDGNDYEEGSTPHMISCTFDFDALHIDTSKQGEGTDGAGLMEAHDILAGSTDVPRHSRTVDNSAGGGGRFSSPHETTISNQGRQTVPLLNGLLNRPSSIAGGAFGLLPNAGSILNVLQSRRPIGNIISPGISRAVGSVISDQAIGGIVIGQIRSQINRLGG